MFPSLPDSSRVWVFATGRSLSGAEQQKVLDHLSPFLETWRSHGRPVPSDAAFVAERLLVVAAHIEDGPNAGVSGCGIDALTHTVDDAGHSVGVEWLDGMNVVYRDEDGELSAVPRPTFRQRVREGAVSHDTIVADTTIADLASLRQQGIERPMGTTWHARVFRLGAAA